MNEYDYKLETDFIEKELLKHFKELDQKEDKDDDVLFAIDNLKRMLLLNDAVRDQKVPLNEVKDTVSFLKKYCKQINKKKN